MSGLVGRLFRARALFRHTARDQERIRSGASSYVGGFQFGFGIGRLILHHAVVQKIPKRARLDGEIDILGDISGSFDKFQCVQFCSDHPDDFTASAQKRAATVARLNRRAYLQVASIVQNAA